LKGAEEGLPKYRVEENCFKSGGKVCIKAFDTERFVVGEMVGLSV
jgi:hypothetical protein